MYFHVAGQHARVLQALPIAIRVGDDSITPRKSRDPDSSVKLF